MTRPRIGRGGRAIALALLALGAAGCMPQGVTEQSKSVNALYQLFFWSGVAVFALVAGLVTFSILRYRHRGGTPVAESPLPPQVHGNTVLEAIWTTIPVLIVIGLFAATMVSLGIVKAAAPPDALRVHVTGFQWDWRFDYTDEHVSVVGTPDSEPEFVIPVGRAIDITLTSADVNHAFWVPAFLFKQDAIPGREADFSFKVDQAGTYRAQCAEFCGVYHDRMLFTVRAVSEAEFASWLDAQRAAASSSQAPAASVSPAVLESPGAAPPAASPTPSSSTP